MKISIAIVSLLSLAGGAFGENLIYNGGFELGTDGFALHRIVTRRDGRHIPLELETDAPARGKYSVRIRNPDGDYFEFYVSSFSLKPDTGYTFSMTAKTDVAGGVPVEALIHDKNWNNKRKTFRIGNQYGRFRFHFHTGKTGGPHVIRLWSFQRTERNGGWKGSLWFDDISVTETGGEPGGIYAGVSGERCWMRIDEKKSFPLRLKLQNDSAQEYRGALTVRTVSEYDGKTVTKETVQVALKPGEVTEMPLSSSLVRRYGSYTVAVKGDNRVRSWDFPYVVIGGGSRVPRDFSRDICVGINGGLGLRSGYVNHKLVARNGYNTYNSSLEDRLALLRTAGIRLLRMWDGGRLPTDWATAEPENGRYDFSFFDFAMEILQKHDLVPVHVLGGELFRQPYLKSSGAARENPIPAWALPMVERPEYHPPYAMQKLKGYIAFPPLKHWRRYMTALAKHAKGRKCYFEFTNEPNLYVAPEVYNRYLKATWEGLKTGDANAEVVGFSVTSDFKADSGSWLEQAVKGGGLSWCDILSFHPYSMRELGSPLPADTAIRTIFELMKTAGKTVPVWNTELYYLFDTPSAGDREQKERKVEYLLTRFLLDCGEGVSQSMPIHESMLWRDSRYLNYIGELIPGSYFVACETLARLFEAAKPVAKHRFPSGVICYVYRKDGGLIAAVWNYRKAAGIKADFSRFEVLDLFGNPVGAKTESIDGKPWLLRPGNMTDTEFLNACAKLKLYSIFPVQASDAVRAVAGHAVAGLHNESGKRQSCTVGFNGGGYSAERSVKVMLEPGESRTVSVPIRRIAGNGSAPKLIVYDGTLRRIPVRVTENVSAENGTSWEIKSPDGKLSARLCAEVKNRRFHLTAKVRDLTDSGTRGTRNPWETDSVELFLDPVPYIFPARFPEHYNQKTARVFLMPRDPEPFLLWSKQWKTEDCKWNVTVDTSGYSVHFECPAEGLPFGFGVKINDAESPRSKAARCAVWGAEGKSYADRFRFGIIRRKTQTEKTPVRSPLADGSFEDGNKGLQDWKRNYSSTVHPADIVPNGDFLNGTQSLQLTASPKNTLSVISRDLPLVPGKKLGLSFWAKSGNLRTLDGCIEVWSPAGHRGEHLYIRRTFHLSDEWKSYTLTLDVPEKADRYPDINDRTARVKFWLPKSEGSVLLDDIEIGILP